MARRLLPELIEIGRSVDDIIVAAFAVGSNMFKFKMPSVNANVANSILVRWNFAVGDRVEEGDILCEIEAAQGTIDVEIWEGGVITELLVERGAKIPGGKAMARLDTGATLVAERCAASPEPAPEPAPVALQPSRTEQPTVTLGADRPAPAVAGHRASPAARQRAVELGIDIDTVVGSGPGGGGELEDIEHAAAYPQHRRVAPVARKETVAAGIDQHDLEPSSAY